MVSIFDPQSNNIYTNDASCFGLCTTANSNNKDATQYDYMNVLQMHHVYPRGSNVNVISKEDQKQMQEMDAMLSEAMNELTFEERQHQQEFLHGVEDQVKEEATFVAQSLRELDGHLQNIKQGSAYETAEQMNPSYVQDKEFRVLFLRCQEYDAKEAADQMLQFFAIKQQLFGVDKLTREITVEDLDADDIAAMNWIRPIGKDRSNRPVYLQLGGLRNFKTLENELRGKFFFQMSLLQDPTTRYKGAVEVNYTVGEFRDQLDGAGYVENSNLSNATPLHHAAVHLCCDDWKAYFVCKLAFQVMPAKLRARFRIHYGSHLECQYRLSTYGISRLLIPLGFRTNMNAMIRPSSSSTSDPLGGITGATTTTMATPEQPSTVGYVSDDTTLSGGSATVNRHLHRHCIEPNANDVLYTNGRTSNNMGNHQVRRMVGEWCQVYDNATNETKRAIVDEIIRKIHEAGGRFLRQQQRQQQQQQLVQLQSEKSGWVLVTMDEVRTKMAQMFRNQKRASSRKSLLEGTPIVGDPRPDDVVFGKSQAKNRGKELLQQLIRERMDEYNALDRGRKATVVSAIFEAIQSTGGRFLQVTPGNDGYLEVNNEIARERISKYFRNYRRANKGKAAAATTTASTTMMRQ